MTRYDGTGRAVVAAVERPRMRPKLRRTVVVWLGRVAWSQKSAGEKRSAPLQLQFALIHSKVSLDAAEPRVTASHDMSRAFIPMLTPGVARSILHDAALGRGFARSVMHAE